MGRMNGEAPVGDVAKESLSPLAPVQAFVGGRRAPILAAELSRTEVGTVELRVQVPPIASDVHVLSVRVDGIDVSAGWITVKLEPERTRSTPSAGTLRNTLIIDGTNTGLIAAGHTSADVSFEIADHAVVAAAIASMSRRSRADDASLGTWNYGEVATDREAVPKFEEVWRSVALRTGYIERPQVTN